MVDSRKNRIVISVVAVFLTLTLVSGISARIGGGTAMFIARYSYLSQYGVLMVISLDHFECSPIEGLEEDELHSLHERWVALKSRQFTP